ncbi:hypothetical protein [Bradyrhizobium sp.]|uniref:hypothetical protein n=1 Tax=Bradyrhizobium sp. TaxID=376 RepID=UPI003BAFEFFE
MGECDFDVLIAGTGGGTRDRADERGIFVIDPVNQFMQQNPFQRDLSFHGKFRHLSLPVEHFDRRDCLPHSQAVTNDQRLTSERSRFERRKECGLGETR